MQTRDREFNPYKPPAASLEPAPEPTGLWFTASPFKLALMSLVTFNIYSLWWFYRNFKVIRDSGEPGIMPFWRAFFSIIWAYSCFKAIAVRRGLDAATGAAAGLAIGYLLLNIASWLPDPAWLVTFVSFAPLLVANGWARATNEEMEPGYTENSRFSAWNWVAIALGGLMFVMMVAGLFIAPPQ